MSDQPSPEYPTPDALAVKVNWMIDFSDAAQSELEGRVIALEEIIAARWPRRMLLRWRLARQLRASARAHAYAGRSFQARRGEATSDELIWRSR